MATGSSAELTGQTQDTCPEHLHFEAESLHVRYGVLTTPGSGLMGAEYIHGTKGLGPHSSVTASLGAQEKIPPSRLANPAVHSPIRLAPPPPLQGTAWCPPVHTGLSLGEARESHTLRNTTVSPLGGLRLQLESLLLAGSALSFLEGEMKDKRALGPCH